MVAVIGDTWFSQWDMKGPHAIIFTCKQLYIEAVKVYAKYTQFFFCSLVDLERFSPWIRVHITDLCISEKMLLCGTRCWRLFRILNAMENLKVLTFTEKVQEHVFERSCPLRNLRGLRELRLEDVTGKDSINRGRPRRPALLYAFYATHTVKENWAKTLQAEGQIFIKEVIRPKVKEALTFLELPFAQTGFGRLNVKTRMRIYALVLIKENKSGDPFSPVLANASSSGTYFEPTFMNDPDRPHRLFHFPHVRKPSPLNILLTCRQIYEEAYPVFYNINRFTFRNTGSFAKFLMAIGKARRHEVKDVEICNMGPIGYQDDFSLLLDCHKLERVRLQIWRSHIEYWTINRYLCGLRKLEMLSIQCLEDERDRRCRQPIYEPRSVYAINSHSVLQSEAPWRRQTLFLDIEKIIHGFEELVRGPHESIPEWYFLSPPEKIKRHLFQKIGAKRAMACELCRRQWDI